MKKLLTIMLIAVVAVSSAFAVSGYIGVSSGYGFRYAKTTDKLAEVGTYVPVSVDGAAFFGKGDFNFGLSYGAEITQLPLTIKMGSLSVDREISEYTWTLAPYAGLGFQFKFSDSFGLAGSVNATFNWGKMIDYAKRYAPVELLEMSGISDSITFKEVGMMGNLYINANFGPVNFRAGGLVEGPIAMWTTTEVAGTKVESDMIDMTEKPMLNVVPFVGIGFAF